MQNEQSADLETNLTYRVEVDVRGKCGDKEVYQNAGDTSTCWPTAKPAPALHKIT